MECKDNMHEFQIMQSDSAVHMEHCARCKKDFVYPLDSKGNIEDKRYLKDHEKDFAQPNNPNFEKYRATNGYIAK
jgi:hypothetical protein